MESSLGILLAIATIIVVIAYIAQPFLAAQRDEAGKVTSRGMEQLKRRADLLNERNQLYAAIKALDFEHEAGKTNEADYAAQRYQLVAQGVDVLQQIDALPISDDDAIERRVLHVREGAPQTASDVEAPRFCPQCGTAAQAGDRFCANCGANL